MARRRATLTLALPLCLAVCALGLGGCKKTVNEEAVKLGQAGSTVSGQMAQYYEGLQQDVIDTWQLDAFQDGYALREKYEQKMAAGKAEEKSDEEADKEAGDKAEPPGMALREYEKKSIVESTQTIKALSARIHLARVMQKTYASYIRLAEYNYSGDVAENTDEVITAAGTVADLALPGSGSAITACLKDLRTHVTTVRQNRALLRESETIVQLLTKVQNLFDAERPLYGQLVAESGTDDYISGIIGERAMASEKVAIALVNQGLAAPDGVFKRVVEEYNLALADAGGSSIPPSVRAGLERSIRAERYARAHLYNEAGAGISRGLGALIKLHRKLGEGSKLSLGDVLDNSAFVEVLLDALRGEEESQATDS